ncbi:MAG: hypothetical protein GX456_15020 [Verrucomicrobia bacterium]|nr:hypothetical protein [Verrucomicrobiota bacterium]
MLVSKPPKGGTLTAVGATSPDARNNPSPLEFRVYAEQRYTFHNTCTKNPASSKPLSRVPRFSWLKPTKPSVAPSQIRSVP